GDDPVHVISTTEERRREKPPDYDTVAAAPPSYDDAIKLDPAALLRLSKGSNITSSSNSNTNYLPTAHPSSSQTLNNGTSVSAFHRRVRNSVEPNSWRPCSSYRIIPISSFGTGVEYSCVRWINNYQSMDINGRTLDTIPRYMNVRVGSEFYNANGSMYGVMLAITHPDHVPYSWIMDFALLQLNDSLVFSAFVQPVALASHPDDLLYDRDCVVTGWGRTLNEEESFEQLRAVEIPLVSRELCNVTYEGKIDTAMVCAGDYINGGKGSCAYDSGGPLVCAGVQVGIVSWGKGCALVGYPEVYSNVLYARKWVEDVIKGLIK
uniref:Uncharacterized protein n=1 Tax=Anopheles stephensi TaxID=30069 RepID=A0A182YHF2_ANOST